MKVALAAAVGLALAGYAALLFSGFSPKDGVRDAVVYIEAQGDNALLAYMSATLIGCVCLIPTTVMEFAGGFLFSPRYGMWTTWALTSVTKLVANVISVWLARNVFREWVLKNFVDKTELLRLVRSAVREEPYKMAFLVRGSMMPLALKNYGLGVLDIGYLPIALNACFFTPFYAYQNIYFGSACQDLSEVFSAKRPDAAAGDWQSSLKAAMPMVFNACLVVVLIRAVKQQLQRSRAQLEASLKANEAKAD